LPGLEKAVPEGGELEINMQGCIKIFDLHIEYEINV
jgi:hypothetical protein